MKLDATMDLNRLLTIWLLCSSLCIVGGAQEVPAGTVLPVMASTNLNSAKIKAGTQINSRLMQDVVLSSGDRIRTGAKVEGRVLEVSPANASSPARVVLLFDRLVAGQKQYAITVTVRALASMDDVFAAQLPWSTFDDYGTSSSDWNTVQVGGAAVYRGDGTVRSAMEVVGHTTDYGAVTAKLMPAPKRGCPASPVETAREQSLWIFSPWACGTYGFEDLTITHSGAAEPFGTIDLTSPKAVNVRAGSGWLLVVVPTPGTGQTASSD